ncbi:MAG: hypothetical protein IJ658_12865 [Kiritimatiellae bacterium]|nr:hypothetical protein [Kiritimatiellia bacterium]
MAEELQQLLEKIQRDGVDKANAEAKAIVDRANAEAKAIVDKANAEAAAATAKAETDAKAFAERASKTIGQAARDTVMEVKNGVNKFFEGLLAQDVKAALAANAAALAAEAIKALSAGSDAQVAANAQLAEALRAQFAANAAKGVTVVTDESVGTGFSVRLDGGRVEHDFSEKAITAALARRLRPDLAKIVEG